MAIEMLSAALWLDRRSGRRSDAPHMAHVAADPATRLALFDGLEPLLHADGDGVRLWTPRAALDALGIALVRPEVYLGVDRATGIAHLAARVEGGRDGLAAAVDLAPPADIRTIATRGLLSAGDTAAAGLARSLFAWHDASRFCGACGAAADLIDAGWRRRCGGCGRDQYPRVDPVVIMLVTDGARCVLAHEPRFPDRMFSCIAGYVEPGEDVAHAVGRETAEELGLAVERVKIVADQPWPLPHSLMIGCIAHVAPAALTIDPTEIAEARWFTRAEADALLARSHPDGIWIPGAQAIAHHLIARFARGDDLP